MKTCLSWRISTGSPSLRVNFSTGGLENFQEERPQARASDDATCPWRGSAGLGCWAKAPLLYAAMNAANNQLTVYSKKRHLLLGRDVFVETANCSRPCWTNYRRPGRDSDWCDGCCLCCICCCCC